jgi:hypothetical protein
MSSCVLVKATTNIKLHKNLEPKQNLFVADSRYLVFPILNMNLEQ